MFKINKYTKLRSPFSQLRRLRHSCGKECPPSYECKQPETSDFELKYEEMKKKLTPLVFRPHCPKDYKIYKNILFFICFPLIICVNINTFYLNPEKPKRLKFLPFAHLRIRKKPFPWDPVRTLFHNPELNALPDGYEVEFPEEDEIDPFESDR